METKVAEFAQKLGARIVQLRKEHNFAQEKLATLARMNKGYLSSVESGQRIPSVGMLAKLSKVLQVQIFDLFVFPDAGPWDRLLEEVRTGTSPAAEQLRAQYGLSEGLKKSAPRGQKGRSARTTVQKKTAKSARKGPKPVQKGRNRTAGRKQPTRTTDRGTKRKR